MKMHASILSVVVLALVLLMPGSAAAQTTWYVDCSGGDDFTDIRPALTAASDGDIIIVRDGVYTGGSNSNLDFDGKAINLQSENGPANCVIDVLTGGRAFYFHSGETTSSVVDGFTITGGVTAGNGGGILCESSSPTITNCIITGNTAGFGGGIYCGNSSSPAITNCFISNNSSGSSGGGIWCVSSSPALSNCVISNNTAVANGGGVYCWNSSSPSITNCTITGNAADFGGGIYCYESSNPTATNCILWDDSAASGPEIYLTTNSSLTVSYSDVEGGQGAAEVDGTSTLTWGSGNIDADPLFTGLGYYRLLNTSPCIDTGTDGGVSTDFFGNSRPHDVPDVGKNGTGDEYDMGVYESRYLYVDDDGMCPGSGTSADPFCDIQTAIDNSIDGDFIFVRDGTYTGANNKNLDYNGKTIILESENGASNCTIDSENDGQAFYFHSAETRASVVKGFTITNGLLNGNGGGIWCAHSSPTITNCNISGNSANSGGAIYVSGDGWPPYCSPKITDCTISGNSATDNYGGGIHTMYAGPEIINCTISGNSVDGPFASEVKGGGISCDWTTTITNCTISNNSSTGIGGGVFCMGLGGETITNCTISGNSAVYGGAIYSTPGNDTTFTNCTISGNSGDYGGGIYLLGGSPSTLILRNCILWGDSASSSGNEIAVCSLSDPSSLTVSYSDVADRLGSGVYVESGCTLTWGSGNIDSDPLFIGAGDYRVRYGSPAIDAGTDAGVYTDFYGNARPYDVPDIDNNGAEPEFDMGAYEARYIYVDDDSPCPGSGTSADPYCDIQTAINDSANGDVITVRDGTYIGANNRDLDFNGKAVTLQSENGAASTIIDCENSGRGFTFDDGEASDSVVDGFTIINGYVTGSEPDSSGGGILCYDSSPSIRNSVINNCEAGTYGGGIACRDSTALIGSAPIISGCIITGNMSISGGGGIHCYWSSPSINNSVLVENTSATYGGALYHWTSNASFANCTISRNSANHGGAISAVSNSSITVANSILWGDTAGVEGSEIALYDDGTELSVSYSDVEGGELAAEVDGTSTLTWGSGNIDSDPLFENPPDFVDWTTGVGTTTTVEVTDASIHDVNDVIEINCDGVARTVSSAPPGTTVTFSPALSAPSEEFMAIKNFGIGGSVPEDLHLRACSPAIDAGDLASDISNEPQPNGERINMGAYGNTADATIAAHFYDRFFASVPDIDGNGTDELVFLGENPSNQKVLAQVWDAETAIRTTNVWYGPVFKPIGVAVVPDINGNGKSEICLLGWNPLNNKVLGHVRDGATNTYLRYVWFGAKQAPVGLKVMEDISGNGKSELVMIARDPDNNKGVAKVYDSATGSMVKLVWYGPVFDTLGLEIISDSNGNGKPDIVQMALNPDNRKVLAHIRDSLTGVWIRYLWFGTQYYPIDLKTVPDVNGNGYDELALLGVDYNTGEVVVKVMDSYTRATLRIRTYFTGYTPIALEVLPDMNGGGRPELAVLAVDPSDGTVYVSIKDSRSGEVVADNSFGSTHEPWGIGMGERYQRRRQA